MEKVGVESLTLTQGKDKDMLNPFRPWKVDESAPLRQITADLYNRFVDIVTQARPALSKEKLVNDYGAKVFIAGEAAEKGYIDNGSSSYSDALAQLVTAAGIKDMKNYQVFTISPRRSLASMLSSSCKTLLSGKLSPLSYDPTPAWSRGKFLYIYQPSLMNVER